MHSLDHLLCVVGLTSLLTSSVCPAQGDDSAVRPDLGARIAELEAQVARLEAAGREECLGEQRAAEIRSLVQDVLADADTRASMLQDGARSGYENGFFIASGDGNFRVNINGHVQFRYLYNIQDNSPVDDHRSGFENARTKLIFTGNVVDPTWIYRVEAAFDPDGGAMGLQDAYIGHALGNGWTVVAGQLKVPMLREELIYSAHQQAIERSLVNQEFTAGRTQGVALDYRDDRVHLVGGCTDGHPATGGFNRPALMRDTEYALTLRGEVLAAGGWSQFDDLASWRGDECGLLIGGAVHYQQGEYGTTDDETEVLQWSTDLSAEFGGANLIAYAVGRHIDTTMASLDQFGIVVQGGLFVTDDWELFARYEWGDDDGSSDDLSIVTVGATRYFARHGLKWSIDAGFALNEVTSTWADGFLGAGGGLAGWRRDQVGEDGQIAIRSQFQLYF